jgi:hypothetical protein
VEKGKEERKKKEDQEHHHQRCLDLLGEILFFDNLRIDKHKKRCPAERKQGKQSAGRSRRKIAKKKLE